MYYSLELSDIESENESTKEESEILSFSSELEMTSFQQELNGNLLELDSIDAYEENEEEDDDIKDPDFHPDKPSKCKRGRPPKKNNIYEKSDTDIYVYTKRCGKPYRKVPISLNAAGIKSVNFELPLRVATYANFAKQQQWDGLRAGVRKQDKNRVAARRSRERKKLYIKTLEESVEIFVRENDRLCNTLQNLKTKLNSLETSSNLSIQDIRALKEMLDKKH